MLLCRLVQVNFRFIQSAAPRTTGWTDGRLSRYRKAMIRRRDDYQPLSDRTHPHWLTVSDMFGAVVDCESIAIGTDLPQYLARIMQQWLEQGWKIEDDGSRGNFFCSKSGVRRFVQIRPTDPAQSNLYGPSVYESCPTCGE